MKKKKSSYENNPLNRGWFNAQLKKMNMRLASFSRYAEIPSSSLIKIFNGDRVLKSDELVKMCVVLKLNPLDVILGLNISPESHEQLNKNKAFLNSNKTIYEWKYKIIDSDFGEMITPLYYKNKKELKEKTGNLFTDAEISTAKRIARLKRVRGER